MRLLSLTETSIQPRTSLPKFDMKLEGRACEPETGGTTTTGRHSLTAGTRSPPSPPPWVQTFKYKYLYFHFGFAEGQSIKISSKYQNIKLLSKYQNIGCIEADFWHRGAIFRILPEFGEFRENSGNIWLKFSKIQAKID